MADIYLWLRLKLLDKEKQASQTCVLLFKALSASRWQN